ncbi:prepilin-type N-terminal cleavage/methylation domain-containing protein [Moorella naiadis]|uniref:prepilin-type N-terminal cleavage/methylation domain-containing protein n=1 Tax=Moorella naiadis (nom. illeg.) TaxID=3093670 RepID=UPI003D9CBE40
MLAGFKSIRNGRGFTLVEMAAVTALAGLLATAALPVVARGLAWWQVQTAAWQLVNEIRNLQQVAMGGEDRHRMILLDADHSLYRLKENTSIVKEVPLPPGVTLELNLQYTGTGGPEVYGNELSFTLVGEPMNSGKIILRDRYGRPYYIIIMPFTGRVRTGSTP